MLKLVDRVFCSNASKRFISSVTVVGAGLMGSGIAQVAAQAGYPVVLVDVSKDSLDKSLSNINVSLQRVAKKIFSQDVKGGQKFVADTLRNLKFSTDVEESTKSSDIVVEAIVEQVEPKRKLFASLEKFAPSNAVFATNTSFLSVKDIASELERRDRFAGLHFFNPVPVMKLVELIRIPETSDDTHNRLVKFVEKIGKESITCKDTPGFVVNRLLMPYNTEALKMFERGDATSEDIDTAMKLGAGYRMGPFELLDYTGLDTHLFIRSENQKRFPNDPMFYKSPVVEKRVSEGKLGVKSGEGFYEYK